MLKRSLAAALAVCMMVVMLTACGKDPDAGDTTSTVSDTTSTVSTGMVESNVENNESGTPTENNSTAQTGSKQTGGGKTSSTRSQTPQNVRLKVWGYSNDNALLSAKKDFEKANPNVKLQVTTPAEYTVAQLQMNIAANTQPDIVMLDHVYITSLGRSGSLLDLNKYGASSVKSKFISSCWKAVTSGNQVFGLPHDGNTIALMYNKDMLNKTGMKAPTDYTSLVKVGKAMSSTSPGKTPYTSPFFDTSGQGRLNWSAFVYFFWLWRCGGEILSNDLSKAAFNSQAGIDALTMLTDLVKKERICEGGSYKEAQFYNGDVGMIEMGNWSIPQMLKEDRNANFGVTLLPKLKNNVPQYSGLGLFAMGVTAKTKYPQQAADFVKYYCTNDEYQLAYAKQNNQLPCTNNALNNSYYSNDIWKVYKTQYGLSKYRPGVSGWDQIEAEIANAVNTAVQGSKSPKSALDAAAAKVNKILAQNK